MPFSKLIQWLSLFCFLAAASSMVPAQAPTPASVLGHTPGDDFYLADYADTIRYFHALAASSDRIIVRSITAGSAALPAWGA